MERTRIVSFSLLSGMVIAGGLYLVLDHSRNDMLYRSRSIISQRQKMQPDDFPFFFNALRYPEGNPDDQYPLLERFWLDTGGYTVREAAYGNTEPLVASDGERRQHRQVRVDGTAGDGEARRLTLEWVRYRGSWYLHGYGNEGEGEDAAAG